MSTVMSTAASANALSWDGEGRRVSGGALAPDLPAAPGEEFTFSDFLSVLNPLQHIPVVSSIYRWATGDTIKPVARVIGGALYGGPMGLATAAFNAIVEQVKGSDLGTQALALVVPDFSQSRRPAGPTDRRHRAGQGRKPAGCRRRCRRRQSGRASAIRRRSQDFYAGETRR